MPGTDPFLTYAEDTSSKVDMAQNIEKGVNDRSVFDQEYYTGKDKVTPPEAQPPAMPPAVAAPLPGTSEYRANPFTGQGPEISTITGHPIKKWGIAAQEPVPSHEVYKPPPEPWDQIALKTWKGIGLQAEKIAGSTVRLASDINDVIAPDSSTPQSRFAMDTEAQDLNRQIAENQPGEGSTWAQRQAFGVGSSLPVLVAAVGGGIVTKAPGFAGYLMGFTSGVEKYSDLKDYGYDTGKAAIVASLYGSADAIFFGKAAGEWQAMLTAGKKAATPTLERTAIEHVSEWAGQAFKKYGVVIGQMELATASKSVVSKLSDQPNMTAHDFAESMFDTLVQGTAIHAGMSAAGAVAGLARKTDIGFSDFKGWMETEFPNSEVDLSSPGIAKVTLPTGRVVEIHTPESPHAETLRAEAGMAQRTPEGKVVSAAYFKAGDTSVTEGDLLFLTGQQTDFTSVGHEKGHLVLSVLQTLMTPEELVAMGLPREGVWTDKAEEKVIGEAYEAHLNKTQATPDNPMSPLDHAFNAVMNFAHEVYTTFGGQTTRRQAFERIRKGEVLSREGYPRIPGETDVQFQERQKDPAWFAPVTRTKGGRVVGAPESHQGPGAYESAVRHVFNVASDEHAVNPEQAQWYDKGIGVPIRRIYGLTKDAEGNWQGNIAGADKFARALALWSVKERVSRNAINAQLAMFLDAQGQPAEVGNAVNRPAVMADRWASTIEKDAEGNLVPFDTSLPGVGEKVASFHRDIMNGTFGVPDAKNATIDAQMISGMELRNKRGELMDGLKMRQYGYARSVIEDATKMFNEAHKTDYSARHVQALFWNWERAGKATVKSEPDTLGKYIPVGVVYGEAIPSTSSPENQWIHTAKPETRKAASDHVLQTALLDENGNNKILSLIGVPQGATTPGVGTWEGAVNPNIVSTFMLPRDMPIEKQRLYADIFGYVNTQDSVVRMAPDANLLDSPDHLQAVHIERANGMAIPEGLVPSLIEAIKKKVGTEITLDNGRAIALNLRDSETGKPYSGVDDATYERKIGEAIDEWQKKHKVYGDINVGHFGSDTELQGTGKDAAGNWSGEGYHGRIASAGPPDILKGADDLRKAVSDAWKEFSDQVAPPGAKFQAKPRIDERFKITLTDINGKDITPAVKAIAYGMGEPIRSVMNSDRIWLTGNGRAIGVPYIHQSTVDDVIAKATSEPIGRKISYEEFGAATQSIRFHGYQGDPYRSGRPYEPSLNFEVFAPITDKQMEIIEKSVGPNRKILVDVSTWDGRQLSYVQGRGMDAVQLLKDETRKAYAPGAKLQTKPMVTTPHGEFPVDHNGWKFEGEWPGTGMYQYSKVLPDSALKATFYVGDPKKVEEIAAKKEAEFAAGGPTVFKTEHGNFSFGEIVRVEEPGESPVDGKVVGVRRESNPYTGNPMDTVQLSSVGTKRAPSEVNSGNIRKIEPKFQTRTPGPKGLTVNFTDPEVNALGEELLRGAFDKLQFTQSNDASLKKAQELIASKKMSLDTFLNHDPYTAWPDTAHQVAAEAIAGGVFDYVKGRIAEYKAGTITADEANKARMVAMASIASWYLPQSEVGRMLQARQMAVSPEGIPIRDLMQEQMTFEKDLQELKNRGLVTDDQVLDAMGKFYSVDQAQNFVSRVAKAKVKEPSALNQLFYFSLLTNPVTHAANVVGNVAPLFFAVADQYLAEKSPFGATPKGGAAGMAAGMIHSVFDAYALMKRSAYTGEAMFGPGKVEGGPARTGIESIDQARSALNDIHNDPTHPYHDPSSSEFDAAKRDVMLLHRKAYNPISGDRLNRLTGGNMDASGFFPRMADFIGEAVDAPFKGLNAEDMFFKVLNQRMWIWKSAYEMAAEQGLEGKAFNEFVATFVDDPPPTTMATANEFALKQTFNNGPGKIAESLMGITREYPIARFILPFVRVPSNIFRFALETTPFAPLLRQVRSDISNGGKARDIALSKMAIGTSMMAGVATLAAAGMITGGGPSDPKQKKIWTDSGWQEYSVKIGGTYYSYKRLDPFAMPIGVAADLVEMARFAPDFGFDEAALVGALSFIRNFTSKSYMQGFADFLTAITAGGEDTMMASATKYGKGLPRTLIPGGVAQTARVTDPMKRNVDGWLDTMKSRIPGLSSTLEPNYNLKGDPITIGMYESLPGKGFGMVNPVLYSSDTKDPVWQEIRRNRVPVTMPARTIGGQDPGRPQLDQAATGQKLTPEQYSWLVKMAGNGLKDPKTGRGAWDELTAIINGNESVATFGGKPIFYAQKNDDGSPVFTDGPDGGKAMIIQKVIGKYREGAKRILEGGEPFPELHNEYVIGQTKKKMNRAPQVGGAR